ncbi:hypothetical protein ACH3O9_00850 [Leeuwenhoekiella sp. A16]|uniref:hypothetical protein n=1 Tax=Leeuwenhoekiella sp. A16 TaxID=3141462 RepID=UPI003A7FD76F
MAGGQATNSGINYQQRISAWFLINQYSKFDISIYFDQLDERLVISKTHFETSQFIDDLNLTCENGKSIFLQIKRSISLSIRDTSDFYKTTRQFIEEFNKNEQTKNYFGLITTSDSSSKITSGLKKIIVSLNLSSDAFRENPLTESESDTLYKFQSIFNIIYEEVSKKKPTQKLFENFLKRIFIGIIDIESGNTVEVASHMLLKSIGFNQPELVWSILIKNSLVYATDRLSIDNNKLEKIFDRYISDEKDINLEENPKEWFKSEVITEGKFSTGKEVLLIKSFIDELDLMIVELYRFTDDCQIKSVFYDNKINITEDVEWEVIQRFSTMSGLDRYLEENQEIYKGMKVGVIPANEIENVENDNCSKLHKSYLEELLDKNPNPLICLHCGKQVSEKNAVIAEIEDRDTIPAFGSVHKSCLRPIDRVIGTVRLPDKEYNNHLVNFDFKLWINLIMEGQGMMNALKSSPQLLYGRTPTIAWNGNEEYDADYSFCINYILEDGSTSYSYQRSKIERLNKVQAQESLKLSNFVHKKQRELNDPYCVLSVSKTAGTYSGLLKIKKTDDVILEIKSAEIANYSSLVAKAFDKDIEHYAPLCIIKNRELETFLNLSNVVPIISDPLKFSDHYDNWLKIGFEIDDVDLKIIKTDKDFDYYMRMIFSDNMVPIIDPLFDKNFQLVSGYPITEYDKLIERAKANEKLNSQHDTKRE